MGCVKHEAQASDQSSNDQNYKFTKDYFQKNLFTKLFSDYLDFFYISFI
jgi:hypothetical protein